MTKRLIAAVLALGAALTLAWETPIGAAVTGKWVSQGHDVYTKQVQKGDDVCLLVVMDHPANIEFDDVTVAC